AMKELENFTPEDVAALLVTLKPQGGPNATVEYATNSYAFYVMQPGKDAAREKYANGLLLALDQVKDKDNKGYVLELLKFCAMKELENFTPEDVAALLVTLKPQGGPNATVEYATNSYAFYVMQPGKDAAREKYANGLLLALDQVKDKDNKGYVLELLKFCAK